MNGERYGKEIKIKLPGKKLDALVFFLKKKDTKVENELQYSLQRLYEKAVPPTVRDYLDEASGADEA